MSGGARDERWLTFEVGGSAWALPIRDVLEVAEPARIAPVPTLPHEVGGVMHYHGDALPIVSRSALFEVDPRQLREPEHVVVVASRGGDVAQLGLPVDRVLGLADAPAPLGRAAQMVAARVPVDGRVTGILDTRHLVERAREVIARAGESSGFRNPANGGER